MKMLPAVGRLLLGLSLGLSLSTCQKNVATGTTTPTTPTTPASTTFANPLLLSGPDPWVYQKDGFYYYLHTTGGDVSIRKTEKMSNLSTAVPVLAWRPAAGAANSRDVWAPELHFLDGKWYIYVTAGPGNCCGGQRLWVLENPSADPTQGTWTEKGRIFNPTEDFWAIDGTVFEQGGKRYFLWSGHLNNSEETQRIYISEMSSPWTLTGPRVELSHPEYTWEKYGVVQVNEGPEILQHNGSTFLIYSASHCSTDEYVLGQLRMSSTADPLVRSNWTKSTTPVFVKNPTASAFGPGHNGFFKSKDGSEDWLIYHANSFANQGCGDVRSPRMQKFTWNADGSPNFGQPLPTGVQQPKPAGE